MNNLTIHFQLIKIECDPTSRLTTTEIPRKCYRWALATRAILLNEKCSAKQIKLIGPMSNCYRHVRCVQMDGSNRLMMLWVSTWHQWRWTMIFPMDVVIRMRICQGNEAKHAVKGRSLYRRQIAHRVRTTASAIKSYGIWKKQIHVWWTGFKECKNRQVYQLLRLRANQLLSPVQPSIVSEKNEKCIDKIWFWWQNWRPSLENQAKKCINTNKRPFEILNGIQSFRSAHAHSPAYSE